MERGAEGHNDDHSAPRPPAGARGGDEGPQLTLREMLVAALTAPSLFFFGFLALGSGALLFALRGPDVTAAALVADVELLARILPRLAAAALVAGLLRMLIPAAVVQKWVGRESGLRGLIAAAAAGMVTLGGPVTLFSMAAALRVSGADRGALVAYVSSWGVLGLSRILTWEIALLGGDFALLRFAVSLPLPILAGLLARALPAASRQSGDDRS